MKTLNVKRVYDDPARTDGERILVDRLWPRGVRKDAAHIDQWAKELAPSKELFTWFHEDKSNHFAQFEKKYLKELTKKEKDIQEKLSAHDVITLITSVKQIEQSHIPTLKQFLLRKLR